MKRTRAESFALTENTHSINNNWLYQDWRSLDYTTHKNIVNSWLLTQRNDKQLKELYGKCSFASGDDWEYYTRGWVIEEDDETFLVYSSEKGSSYEIVSDNRDWDAFAHNEELGKKLIKFTVKLVTKMRALEINQERIAEWGKFEKEMKDKENE